MTEISRSTARKQMDPRIAGLVMCAWRLKLLNELRIGQSDWWPVVEAYSKGRIPPSASMASFSAKSLNTLAEAPAVCIGVDATSKDSLEVQLIDIPLLERWPEQAGLFGGKQ